MNINLNLFMKKNFNRHLKNMNHQTRRTRNSIASVKAYRQSICRKVYPIPWKPIRWVIRFGGLNNKDIGANWKRFPSFI